MDRPRSLLIGILTSLALAACGSERAGVGPEASPALSTASAAAKPGKAPCHRWQACVPENPCHTGWVTGCRAGQPICTDIGGWLSNGTSCGAASVCFMGECRPCAAGEACQPTDPWNNPLVCRAGAIQCATGQPVCVESGPAADGSACWPGSSPPNICDDGQCVWCWEGSSCSIPEAPCRVGAMACSAGADCIDTGMTQPDGTWCGYQQVCSGGACVGCEWGLVCTPEGMPCWSGSTDCSSGTPFCAPQWPQPPGTSCGDGLVCDGSGGCVTPCSPGVACSTGNPCEAGAMSCASASSGWCQPAGTLPDGTDCGGGAVCRGGICQSCGPSASCQSPDPCHPFATISCETGACTPTAVTSPDGTGCGFAGETCQAGACSGMPGAAIVVRALPGPSADLTGTTWRECIADEPLPGQSRLATDTFAPGTWTHVDEIFVISAACQGEPDPAQRLEATFQVTPLGDRLVGWEGTPPPGLPAQLLATALEISGDWPGTGPFSVRTLAFVDGGVYPRLRYEGKDYPAPDGVPTRLANHGRPELVAPSFTQDDLTGEWDVLRFSTNDFPAWSTLQAGVDGAGAVTLVSYLDHTGSTAPPAGGPIPPVSIDGGGTVRWGGTGLGAFHGTMTRSKTLIFATETGGPTPSTWRDFIAWRKRMPGVTYGPADLAGVTVSFHGISAGSPPSWVRAGGSTDAAGVLTFSEVIDSTGGTQGPGPIPLTIDASGLVTSAPLGLHCAMAAAKDALLCVVTMGDAAGPRPAMAIMLLTGGTFTQADLQGAWSFHGVIGGATTAASSWMRGSNTIDEAGTLRFGSFLNSAGSTTPPAATQYLLSPGGVVTTPANASFRGQLSSQGEFYVRTSGAPPASPLFGVNAR